MSQQQQQRLQRAIAIAKVSNLDSYSCGEHSQTLRIEEATTNKPEPTSIERTMSTTTKEIDEKSLCPGHKRCIVKHPPQGFMCRGPDHSIPPQTKLTFSEEVVVANELEEAVFHEINRMRRDPPAYARFLAEKKKNFVGKTLWAKRTAIQTEEGPAAFDEAIEALNAIATPLPSMGAQPTNGMCLAARNLAEDIGPKGLTGHRGTDESTCIDRVGRYGVWSGKCFELISFGVSNPTDVVCQLLVDDGNRTRLHRGLLLDPAFREMGVCLAPHLSFGCCCVIVVAARFATRSSWRDLVSAYDSSKTCDFDGVCSHCFGRLQANKAVWALGGRPFHRHCLLCTGCKSTLRLWYFVVNEAAFCEDCVAFRHPARCTKCRKKVTSLPLMKLDGHVACEECFLDVAVMLNTPYKHETQIVDLKAAASSKAAEGE